MKRIIIRVCWRARDRSWCVTERRDGVTHHLIARPTKREAVDDARARANSLAAGGRWVQLFIHIKAGNRIARHGEHTYPRSSDPRRSRG